MASFMRHGCTPDITFETSENVVEESMTRYGRKKKGLFWVMSLGSGEVGMLEGVGLKVARDKTL